MSHIGSAGQSEKWRPMGKQNSTIKVSFSTIIISKSHNYLYALQELKEIHIANESMRLALGATMALNFPGLF